MKKYKLFYIVSTVFLLLSLGWITYRHVYIKNTYSAFLKKYHIAEKDIFYTSKDVAVKGSGLIFYQAHLPALKINHSIDKLIIRPDEDNISIQMQGLTIDIMQTLSHYYGQKIIEEAQKYTPFTDAFKKPFISLALMGYKKVKGDAVFVFNPNQEPLNINAQLSLPHLAEIELNFTMSDTKGQFNKNILYAPYGLVPEVRVKFMNNGIFQKYADYLVQTNTRNSIKNAQKTRKQKDIIRRFNFKNPIDLRLLYNTLKPTEKN